jgi:S1-C subfamily serine protease
MMMSFSPLVKATAPAVVNVYADRMVQRRMLPFGGDPFFEQFFGQRMPNRTERSPRSAPASSSSAASW